MHGQELLHTLFSSTLKFIHAKRLSALLDAVQSLLLGKRLSLSGLGRSLQGKMKERHGIRKMDRLLGNMQLHSEITDCYHALSLLTLSGIKRPIISIDWACTDKRKDWHILRATLNIQGRGLALYQEVHPQKKANSRQVQNHFIDKLKKILPPDCHPIIVADAGFRFPWFKKLKKAGFDFVGRVRNKTGYKSSTQRCWRDNCLDLYKQATAKAKRLGEFFFTEKDAIGCEVILLKQLKKGRKHTNRSGKRTNNNASNRCARSQRDPWLLVTSLKSNEFSAKDIARIYARRMQIEEDFRDIKSTQFGFGLRYAMSKSAKRIEVLLLIAALAALSCWLISFCAKEKNIHLDFQSNSIRHRNILSVIYLGCQIARKNILFSLEELKNAYFKLQQMILLEAL